MSERPRDANGDDTEGHGIKFGADAERTVDDDVAGHMQPPPDLHRDR